LGNSIFRLFDKFELTNLRILFTFTEILVIVESVKIYLLFFLVLCSFIFKKNDKSEVVYFEEFNALENVSPELLEYLEEVKAKKDSGIDIFQIGDSHVQIGEFSKGFLNYFKQKDIFIQKSWYLPNLVFEDLSFANKSLKKVKGIFENEKITKKLKNLNIGLTGRTFRFANAKTILKFKYKEKISSLEFLHSFSEKLTFESNKKINSIINLISLKEQINSIRFKKLNSRFKLTIKNPYKELIEFYAMRHNFIENKLSYSNFGVGGAKFQDFIFAPKFFEQLDALKPEIIIFTLGTNDSYYTELSKQQFSKQLAEFIEKIKDISPKTELILMNVPDTYFKEAKPSHLAFVNSEIERIAEDKKCAFWNWNKIMGGNESVHKWKKRNLMDEDLLHFSSDGYLLLGELFGKAFLK
jgi:lysophospholipase L1-like esterase